MSTALRNAPHGRDPQVNMALLTPAAGETAVEREITPHYTHPS